MKQSAGCAGSMDLLAQTMAGRSMDPRMTEGPNHLRSASRDRLLAKLRSRCSTACSAQPGSSPKQACQRSPDTNQCLSAQAALAPALPTGTALTRKPEKESRKRRTKVSSCGRRGAQGTRVTTEFLVGRATLKEAWAASPSRPGGTAVPCGSSTLPSGAPGWRRWRCRTRWRTSCRPSPR